MAKKISIVLPLIFLSNSIHHFTAELSVLKVLFGSLSIERVLIFLVARNEGHGREIANYFKSALKPIQNQLEKLEEEGVLGSRVEGRIKYYTFNLTCPYLDELTGLLLKTLSFYPAEIRQDLIRNRRRPGPGRNPLK